MSFFGVQINAQINRLILEIRLKLSQNKFAPNFRTIYRSLASYDPEISGLIETAYFQKALNQNGIFLKKYDFQAIQKAYRDESGKVNWFHFLQHLKEPMGPVRRQLVEKIFDSIDVNKEGKVTPEQLMLHFDAYEIDAVKKNLKPQQEIINQFISMLSIPQDYITRDEFISFYDDCNINFHHNDVFTRYVSSQWNYTTEKLQEVKQAEVKAVSKELRAKLIQKSQGTKDEYLVRKLFEEFDLNQNYSIGPYELDLMLKKLKVTAAPQILQSLLQKLDGNKTGFIEYDEFKKYLAKDPYPL